MLGGIYFDWSACRNVNQARICCSRHIGELVPVFRPVAVFFGQCRESGKVAHAYGLPCGCGRRLAGSVEDGKFHVDFTVVVDGLEHVLV